MKFTICLIEDVFNFEAHCFEVKEGYLNLYDSEGCRIACYKPDYWQSIEQVQEKIEED
jgi:hypothetical protein